MTTIKKRGEREEEEKKRKHPMYEPLGLFNSPR